MTQKALKGQWVKIHKIILDASQRAPNVPEDTKKVPLEMWLNGFLNQEEATLGEEIEIKTVIGRTMKGTLVAIDPVYDHSFGRQIPELISVGPEVREFIDKGDQHE